MKLESVHAHLESLALAGHDRSIEYAYVRAYARARTYARCPAWWRHPLAPRAALMAGQWPAGWPGGHGWARFRTRLSLSFDFSRIIFAHAKKWEKGEGEPGNEAKWGEWCVITERREGRCYSHSQRRDLETEGGTMCIYRTNSENERCPYLEQYHYYEIVKDAYYIIKKELRFTSEEHSKYTLICRAHLSACVKFQW